jgi:hypothetical protein
MLFCASSPREHQHDDETGGENCGLQIQCKREVGGGAEELKKSAHPVHEPSRLALWLSWESIPRVSSNATVCGQSKFVIFVTAVTFEVGDASAVDK